MWAKRERKKLLPPMPEGYFLIISKRTHEIKFCLSKTALKTSKRKRTDTLVKFLQDLRNIRGGKIVVFHAQHADHGAQLLLTAKNSRATSYGQ